MRLVKFSVRNYRSIIETHAIELGDWTVLVGPNNEGKSNLLMALATALDNAKVLRSRYIRNRTAVAVRPQSALEQSYVWSRDFPLGLQDTEPGGETAMRLWFELSDAERGQFHSATGTRLRTALSLELRMGQTTRSFRVRLSGPAQQSLSGQRETIAAFIEERLDFDLISAVRTANDAAAIVRRTIVSELIQLEADPAYQQAVDAIISIEQPILDRVAAEIQTTLAEFLPAVRAVQIRAPIERRVAGFRGEFEIVVDDGNPTPLAAKGDGVQSIAALSLRRAATLSRAAGKDLILLVEEPEAHLHPGAARKLRKVLEEVSRTAQVVMTTHHPAFVDRNHPKNNVIVEGSRARAAASIEDIRQQLGLQASDNLRNAELVLLVEGDTDAVALRAIFQADSVALAEALANGRLAIEGAGGADRVPFHASVLKMNLCHVHAFLDYDSAGRGAAASAQQRGILEPTEIQFAASRGALESELEDLYDPAVYSTAILQTFGVAIPSPAFNRARSKWSGRMGAAFLASGRDWDQSKETVKVLVAAAVAANPTVAISANRRNAIEALIGSLEAHLQGR